MNMPTVCDCGELVEFDDMKPIGNQLYCEDCYQEQKSEEQEDIQPLYEMQDILDKRIIKEKGLESYDLLEEKILALQVELAECANEWRGFKYWSKNQEPCTELSTGICTNCAGTGNQFYDDYEMENDEDCHVCGGVGFTWEEIKQAYYDKNKVNHERQNNGY